MKKILLSVFLLALVQGEVFSQEEAPKLVKRKYQFIPALGVGAGFSKFEGDVADRGETNVHFLGNRFGYNASLSMNLSNSFYVNIDAIIGKISGNENSFGAHRNFESKMMNFGLNLEYNFGGLYKLKRPFLTPFISAGIYCGSYTTSTDLYDDKGNLYYYWSDGKIRDIAQNAPNADDANRLSRDYNYETQLGSNPFSALSLPVSGGADFHVGKRLIFRLKSSYFFSFSDKLDGFDIKPVSKNNDGFFYNSISVFFNLVPDKSNYISKELRRELDSDDYDGDAVPDVEDECGGTPLTVAVDKKGCPIDMDSDGIPDYLDVEPNSPTQEVDVDGAVFDYLKIAKNAADSISILHTLLDKYPYLLAKSKNIQFTVHVGTFDKSNYRQRLFLQSIPGVKEIQVNDSLFVYSVGNYQAFEAAEQKKNELQKQGLQSAFEVPSDRLKEAAANLNEILQDTLETPEDKKIREAKLLAQELERQRLEAAKGPFIAVGIAHSEEKLVEAKLEAALPAEEKKAVQQVKQTAVVEEKAKVNETKIIEEKKAEPVVEEKPKEITEEKVEAVAPVVEKKEEKEKQVVKFCVDIVEHPDRPLPFSVLMIMEREGVSIQTSRVMGAKIYTVGGFKTVKEAEKLKAEIAGFDDTEATVIGSINNIKVTQKEAEDMLKKTTE